MVSRVPARCLETWKLTVLDGRFLLKYATRDTVELLERGTGGVSEASLAIDKYDEKSPLYGLVQYRRRKVILKYVPEGTSRLLQGLCIHIAARTLIDQTLHPARLAVQFQSILETFAPHETVFSFKAASELNESTLASACMLHTSAASLTSDSSSSLRKSRLGGIAEDVEEGATAPIGKARNLTTPERPESSDTKSSKAERVDTSVVPAVIGPSPSKREEESASNQDANLPTRVDSLAPPRATPSPGLQENKSSVSSLQADNPTSVPSPQGEKLSSVHPSQNNKSSSPTLSFDKPLPAPPELTPQKKQLDLHPVHHEEENGFDYRSRQSHDTTRPSFDHRQSSQIIRPQADDAASQYSSYSPYKPKKKLGPRPHKDPEGRPKTSGAASKDQRAVANLPTNLRISNRPPPTNVTRPGSQHSSRSVPSNFRHRSELLSSESPPPLPQAAAHITDVYRSTDAGSFISTAALNPQKATSITPEKLRLMKALQMRKKQQALARRASTVSPPPELDILRPEKMAQSETEPGTEKSSYPTEARSGRVGSEKDDSTAMKQETDNAPPPPSNGTAEVHSPTSALPEIDHPTPSLAGTNTTPTKALQKERPVKKDSGISSLEDAETSKQEPAVPSSTPQNVTEVPNQIDVPEINPPGLEAVFPKANDGSKADESKTSANTVSSHLVVATSDDEPQTATTQDTRVKDIGAKPSISDNPQADTPDQNQKRRNLVEPIKILSSPEASDVSDDDSFVEELEHAKLEEAKPISVARSPITPIFRNSSDRLSEVARAVSAPIQVATDSTAPTPEKPRTISGRSVSTSTALPPLPPAPGDVGYALAAKKGTVSSGITTRIKALESFSRREVTGSPLQITPPQPISQKSSPSIWSFKKRASLAQIRSNPPNTSTSKLPPKQLPTPQPTLTAEKMPTSPPRPWPQRTGSAPQVDAPMQKGDSISVTARIIRDPNQNSAELADNPSEPVPMNLHRSPLTVEHERSEPQAQSIMSSAASTIRPDSRPTSPKVERSRFSFSSTRSSVPKLMTSDSMASRISQAGNQKKRTSGNVPLSPSDASSIAEDRPKESRASRLMKRMSNLTGGSRRNIFNSLSPNGREQIPPAPIAERRESLTEQSSLTDSLSHVVDIGDVNVQFPDTLLWKRRFMRIDDQGYLVLTPPTKETMERNRGISRRFHLSDFRKPTLPDPEREELPWSILLDFEDGTCLQCACESRYAQTQVLRSRYFCAQVD